MDTTTTARDEMVRWLQTDEAAIAARSDLRRAGLDAYDPADVVQDVALRLLRAEVGDGVDNVVGYARRAIQRRVTDLLRGDLVRDRHRFVPSPGDPDGDLPDVADPLPEPGAVVAAAAVEDGVRRALQLALATARAWVVAASLGTLTLRLHPDVAVPRSAPVPDNGDADAWAALWLAGEVDVFPSSGTPDSPAVRQARSRRLREVDRLLRTVAAEVLGVDRG